MEGGDQDAHMKDILPQSLVSSETAPTFETQEDFTDEPPIPDTANGTIVKSSADVPPLKGEGIKREDVFDYQYTGREEAPRPAKFDVLPHSTLQTGLVYDVRMRFHVEPEPEENDIHPEDPRRIHAIFEAFVQAGLAWGGKSSGKPASLYQMGRVDARMVTKEEVCRVHTQAHWEWVQSLASKSPFELISERQHPEAAMDSVYMSPSTPYCAALSAGGAIEACRAVVLGKVKNIFAVIRPPGHHAEREDAKGFCFYDNVSIALKACQEEFGDQCRRVMVLDWDVHHGNGIQQANYEDPNVLYISLHVHERGRFYPECSYRDNRGPYGDHLHCGAGAGLGKNVNIPWSQKKMGDADYIYAFQQIVMPIATEFNPDLVIIAAGFDAAEGDMLGGCKVTPAGYAHMTHMLMSLAKGKLAVCLEGGYNLESIARSSCAVGRTLMGEPPDRIQDLEPSPSAVDDIKLVLRQQSRFWQSLYPKDLSMRLAGPLHGERMHNVVRQWQATTLWDEFEMSPLFVHREKLSKSFENQVLATPNYMEARPLLVVLHDPPEILASPDPRTGQIDLHNTWLVSIASRLLLRAGRQNADFELKTDIVKTYVDWAAKQGFGVIDVNLPKLVDDDNTHSNQHEEEIEKRTRIDEATELLTYLWDNYIDLNDTEQVFLLGTNVGHSAIINFIKANEERVCERIGKAISFVEDVPLQSCKSSTNDRLAPWYYDHSLVFVAKEHNLWYTDFGRKIRKRFGRPVRSTEGHLSDMLMTHRQAVFDDLLSDTQEWRITKEQHGDDHTMADAAPLRASPNNRLPPVGNFALSPTSKNKATSSPRLQPAALLSSPRLRNSRPASPTKLPVGAFPERPPRSPVR